MSTTDDGQLGMDEELLDDPELLEALEARAIMYAGKAAYAAADKRAKTLIGERLEVGIPYRIGRFRVERVPTEPHHVEFDAEAGDRVSIAEGEA